MVGYRRAVRGRPLVLVGGTTATGPDGDLIGEGNPYREARQLSTTSRALAQGQRRAGRRHPDALYVTDIAQWEEVGRAHGEVFGKSRPVTAMVEVSDLIDPRMLVEVEATAWTGGGR